MRARTAVTAAALAATAALTLTACGGDSGGSDKITAEPSSTTATTASASPTATASTGGVPTTIDPALKLPSDLKVVFDWTPPADHAQSAALKGAANYLQAIDHAVAKQNKNDPPLFGLSAENALAYAQSYVAANVKLKETLTGTDRYYRPQFKPLSAGVSVEIALCNSQVKLYSKVIATGEVHVTQESARDYVLYDIVMVKSPTGVDFWQAKAVTVTEGAVQCKR